ncbi:MULTISPECIES: 3-keto-5-aminohexanoate cleavage protein [unclassified Halomonas]|uniref:3-keto-5-aminohexanoate cleavage protein n=1 Tax=unclassified Halomonas TaxID=2609666 RepID=UPI0009904427|nr:MULTISPECIES: 3-keto-5-aminohexanoate cleavage protein [unclassified Halomonas]AQU82808.1 3-keto-5-aminohexanoate cleavage protein [Halomonas sp. 'Soap Lake \
MEKLIITAAVNGGITSRGKNPNVPYTPEEIAESVYQCWQAGASIAHIHARDSEGRPSYEFFVWKEIVERVRERCDIVINLSTSGLNLPSHLAPEEAWNHLSLCPEIASFNCGSVNHGAKPFINPPALAKKLAEDIARFNVIPEIEVYHSGVINEAVSLRREGFINSPMLFSFAVGIHGGVTAECKNLINLIDNIPGDSMWSAIGIGRDQLPINIHTILLGGHVRTGLEDNVYYRKGELATGSAQLVERIVRISRELGRDISSPAEARKAMGLNFERAAA